MKVAVIGAGIVGLATASSLIDSGAEVTCYEAVGPMSQRSAGPSRIFRLAHGVPKLVELAGIARRRFETWGRQAGIELIDDAGVLVSGGEVPRWTAAMSAADAEHRLIDLSSAHRFFRAGSIAGPVLLDPAGGVVDARRTGEVLTAQVSSAILVDPVSRLEPRTRGVRVWSGARRQDVDGVVIAAGAGTCRLAAQVGLTVPGVLHHHVRFTFPLLDPGMRPPCILEMSEAWRMGFTTYQHLAAPGQWAIGAHLNPNEVAWELGREQVVERSRRLTREYVRENLPGVVDRPVDELYCTMATGWADGFGVLRSGSILAVHGDNLFKLAPVLGEMLAEAMLDGSTPRSVNPYVAGLE